MEIVDFEGLEVGDDLLLITEWQKVQTISKIVKRDDYNLYLENGTKVSRWGSEKGAMAIKADHPDILEARELYELKAITSALNFGSTEFLKNPEIAKKIREIKDLMPDKIEDRISSLKSMCAIGSETSDLGNVAKKLLDKQN